ncbi:TetR/AcrR family transcriptional regulator [Lentimicrobium sp. S6]|uniref:TetR/AcrR family transcriptional regulator n=1 Tax=Lentimicrobium sp. S6 TaxID=2735872 RepID=UPI0015517535|nr:TetR/AcrR family transcriptional regulator [Lentimicrobium sp. S6]NPD45865.1 TetR/AcrR family transcriptional regulator [Lentimicrobium sp. S6]
MTDKKEKILQVALQLFSEDGFDKTSTSKIAKLAGVSEGLIFRHFKNKEGLLHSLNRRGEEKTKALFRPILFETGPENIIRKTIDLVIAIRENEEIFQVWKLEYKTKWAKEEYGAHKMEPLRFALTAAFQKLGYVNPKQESLWLIIQLDGLVTRLYLQEDFDLNGISKFIWDKYKSTIR